MIPREPDRGRKPGSGEDLPEKPFGKDHAD